MTLKLLLPYHPYDQPMPIPEGFDDSCYPPDMESVPKRFAIVRANQYMIRASTHLIAYALFSGGGAGGLVEYARKREERGLIRVENLAQKMRPYAR